ncbi:MAG: FAD-dependent oxidoreductase, partial [Bacillota bacterium]
EDELWFLVKDSVVKMGFKSLDFGHSPYNKFTVIRSKFDKWYAEKAEEAGAHLITSTLVEDFVREKEGLLKQKISGVVLENGDKIYADIVIIAEGVISYLTQKAGLQKKESKADYFKLYVKELLYLPEEKINERFNLESNQGLNIGIVGYPTSGNIGKGGIWTNKNTISIMVGLYLNQLIDNGFNVYQLLSRLKQHPLINKVIHDSESIEYLSYVIPKTGNRNIPQLYDSGVMVTGDTILNVGGEGTVLAILSGKYAAETARLAFAKRDFSKDILATYEKKLKNSYIMKNNLSTGNEDIYYNKYSDADFLISEIVNNGASEFFDYSMITQKEKFNNILEEIKTLQPLDKTLVDFIKGINHWRIL